MGSRHPVPHGGVYRRDRYQPLIQWVYQMERDRKVRAADITVPARHKVRYCTQSQNTHVSHTLWFTIPINHWRRLISYGFQFPPGHICIDQLQVWGCARRRSLWHWRMARRSLRVHVSVFVCVCGCRGTTVGFVHMQRFCSTLSSPPRLQDTNPRVWVITSENVRILQTETVEWGLERYCYSDHICSV